MITLTANCNLSSNAGDIMMMCEDKSQTKDKKRYYIVFKMLAPFSNSTEMSFLSLVRLLIINFFLIVLSLF